MVYIVCVRVWKLAKFKPFIFTESNVNERRGQERERERRKRRREKRGRRGRESGRERKRRGQEANVRQQYCTHRNTKIALVSQELSLPFHQHLQC